MTLLQQTSFAIRKNHIIPNKTFMLNSSSNVPPDMKYLIPFLIQKRGHPQKPPD